MKVSDSTLQTAIAATSNAHTGLHQALSCLKQGSTNEAKGILARQIAVLANVLLIL
jgi:hypothetical protein